jgi:hypothetical protein
MYAAAGLHSFLLMAILIILVLYSLDFTSEVVLPIFFASCCICLRSRACAGSPSFMFQEPLLHS